jgi:hypothetical protein
MANTRVRVRPTLAWHIVQRNRDIHLSARIRVDTNRDILHDITLWDDYTSLPICVVVHSGNGLWECQECGHIVRGTDSAVAHMREEYRKLRGEPVI